MEKYSLAPHYKSAVFKDLSEIFSDYHPLLKKLLLRRGITDEKSAEDFLNPDYENHLHDPFLLPDAEKAVARIIQAIENNQKILIYSDYDADGIPGAVIFHDFFKLIGFENFENYIPHRHTEGFGFHLEAVEKFSERGIDLIITVDCGTADIKEVERAKNLGIDVIVTDHHEQKEELPPAYAIVNPKRRDSSYPFPHICGAAVAFKLVQAILSKNNFGLKPGKEKWFLDLVGIATLSDMVPLVGENRVLAHFGLKVLRKSPRLGLVRLLKKLNIDQKNLSEDDIGFMITPRINAASRMGNPDDAFLLLSTKDLKEAEEAATHLNKINDERKGVVASIVKEVKKKIEIESRSRVIVTGNPDWRPSLLGLVAGNLAEEFGKPVFLWGRDGENVIKGSCRSDGKADILEIMEKTKECFIEYGGHKMAGGFSVTHKEIHFLSEKLEKAYISLSEDEGKSDQEKVILEGKLLPDEVSWQTYLIIDKLSPFGVGNPKPLFLLENLEISSVKTFGKKGNHLEISFKEEKLRSVKAIRFFVTSGLIENLNKGTRINLIASVEKHTFNGRKNLRLRIEDIFVLPNEDYENR